MGSSQLVLLAFGSGTLVAGAGAWFIRALVFPPPSRRIRRAPDVFDENPARGLGGKIDQEFNRLAIESGLGILPVTMFMLLLCTTLIGGGVVWFVQEEPLLSVSGALAGFLIPLCFIAAKRLLRLHTVRTELPHVLDMLARATRAGRSIDQAIDLIAHEAGGILGEEFTLCSQQLGMGRSFERVMKTLATRVRLVEMRILSTTLIVQKQSGGKLSETLERMASVVRDRLSSRRQIQAATGAGRASTLIIATVSPLAYAFVWAFHRQHLQVMLNEPVGRAMLLVALVLEVIGLFWVLYLLRTESQ